VVSEAFWVLESNFMKKKNLKIPYLVSVVFPTGIWAFLCAAFGAFLILGRADFEATGTRTVFIFSFPLCMLFTVLLAFTEYGISRFIGIKERKEYLRLLNDNIVDGRLLPNLPTETVKKIFYAIFKQPGKGIRIGYKYGILIISLTLFIEWFASGWKTTNLPIIFISGVISYSLVALFGSFVAERSVYSIIKECRKILTERKEEFEEPKLITLRKKFNYFLLVPLLVIVAIFSFIPFFDLNVVIFSFLGLIMIAVINYNLSSSIYGSFSEIENFAKNLPKGEKAVFSTGSLTSEIASFSKSLNEAANEIYISRKEIEQRTKKLENSYQEIKKRKDELERFYQLTIGRELKMVELKKQIEDLKRESKKMKRQINS